MKKTKLFFAAIAIFSIAYTTQSCQDPTPEPTEFIADNSTFANFTNWELAATNVGPSPSLGAAHAGNDSTVTRKIYYKDAQAPVDGVYPVGTVIVKHSANPAGTVAEYTGMVKRGNSFNPSHNDWEWFMLESNGNIATDSSGAEMRGANLMNGMCNNCHSVATTDYSFSK
ncbi:hypothetical protein [Aureispira anguillae]|uniref:Cytochrome P460 domain-containing protein n=1 Tax=Aureispira anguillae TaxID=2864201 RepID=A0A915YBD9_9BACT|nr:hypothetical protein [Aureispira anguillae]BDS09968.1 hypothetical protein AsAng_0006730 [Aureispira anguillae]